MADPLITLGACGKQVQFILNLDPTDAQEDFLLQHFTAGQCYEAELAWVMFRALNPGDFAIDVGANIGFFTILMSKLVGSHGIVFAFEPGANNLPKLSANLKKNSIINVQVIERPAWSHEEKVTFYINSDSGGGNALFDPGNWWSNDKSRAHPQPVEMTATTLDMLDISKERVKLIKIDTEGAEQRVLEGASGLLRDYHPPYIIAEINPHGLAQAGCDGDSLRAFMLGLGYDMFLIHKDDQIPAMLPAQTRIAHTDGVRIINVLFSTLEAVGAVWPEVKV